jgi:hypothetical protein
MVNVHDYTNGSNRIRILTVSLGSRADPFELMRYLEMSDSSVTGIEILNLVPDAPGTSCLFVN